MTGDTAVRQARARLGRRQDSRGVLGQTLGELSALAGQTPWSGDRPWRLRLRAGAVELLADRSSRRHVFAAGSALLNVRIALEHAGLEPTVTAAPAGEADVLVRVRADDPLPRAPDDPHLYAQLQQRQEGAPRFTTPAVPAGLAEHLYAAAETEGARLVPFGKDWSAGSPYAVWLLVTAGDSVLDWLRAGQAAQRLLLTAGAVWLTARCHVGVLDRPEVREQMRRDHCPDGVPQVILELGQRTATVA